jgi:hypothetical protein
VTCAAKFIADSSLLVSIRCYWFYKRFAVGVRKRDGVMNNRNFSATMGPRLAILMLALLAALAALVAGQALAPNPLRRYAPSPLVSLFPNRFVSPPKQDLMSAAPKTSLPLSQSVAAPPLLYIGG